MMEESQLEALDIVQRARLNQTYDISHLDAAIIEELIGEVTKLRSFERGYAKPHTWNFIAKELRENYLIDATTQFEQGWNRSVEALSLDFARRFRDEDGFDPVKFLDQCSPDPDFYPFSELWEE